jgi:hypothetical protein
MTSLQAEPNTKFSQNYVESLFAKLPADSTKYKSEFMKIIPSTGFTALTSSIIFNLPSMEIPFAYEIGKVLIVAKVVIKDAVTGNKPERNHRVCGSK